MNSATIYLASITGITEKQILRLIKNINKYYKEILRPKMKHGKPQRDKKQIIKLRELHTSLYPLKQLQKTIYQKMLKQVPLPGYVYGSTCRKSNIQNALRHSKNKYFLTIDLKDYFFNIKEEQVLKMYLNNGFSIEMATLLTNLTTYKGFLPQGAPTSPAISNLVFVETGVRLFDLCMQKGITFTTYLDDLVFSSKADFKELVSEILRIVKDSSFHPHPGKIHYRKSSAEVTGLIVRNGRLFFTKEMLEGDNSGRLEGYKKGIRRAEQKFLLK